ncbi:MAG: glycosyltransferase family 2 protein [Cyclobacteriaceae bacterium]
MSSGISIIIPTLNEEAFLRPVIAHTLSNASDPNNLELIVVDAGSSDQTLATVSDLDISIFEKPDFKLKKYLSLNFGIDQSKGDVLIFLDADTLLPAHFDSMVLETLKDERVVGGAFEHSFDKTNWKLWCIQTYNRLRYRAGHIFFGDQAIFCKRSAAVRIGGFPSKQLMESAYFCKELKKEGKLRLIKHSIRTSSRRFEEHGFLKVSWFDLMMWFRFRLNLPVKEYGKKYWGMNLKSNG